MMRNIETFVDGLTTARAGYLLGKAHRKMENASTDVCGLETHDRGILVATRTDGSGVLLHDAHGRLIAHCEF